LRQPVKVQHNRDVVRESYTALGKESSPRRRLHGHPCSHTANREPP
jgi:hypothetical protein